MNEDAATLFLLAGGWTGLLGWAGSLLYLANHAALSLVRPYPEKIYLGANLVAALSVAIASVVLASWQSVGVNAFWAIVSLQAMTGPARTPDFLKERQVRLVMAGVVLAACLAAVQSFQLGLEILGWSSVIGFGSAYFLFANNKISRAMYFLYNGWAAVLILPILWIDGNWPVLALECCWAALSFGSYVWERLKQA